MARPRRDGSPSRQPNRRKLTDSLIKSLKGEERSLLVWDTQLKGFAVSVQPSGSKAYKVAYHHRRRLRWYHVGNCASIPLTEARKIAARVLLSVANDCDPQAERKAQRSSGTFEELADQYLERYAKKKNKSWPQAAKLVARHLTPRWGKLGASLISRSDVKRVVDHISSESVANQTLAAASAIFSWAIREEVAGVRVNPCQLVERNEMKSRDRVLSDSEILFFGERSTPLRQSRPVP